MDRFSITGGFFGKFISTNSVGLFFFESTREQDDSLLEFSTFDYWNHKTNKERGLLTSEYADSGLRPTGNTEHTRQ